MLLTVALLLCLDAQKHALVAETNPFERLREELEIRVQESDAAPRRETADVRTVVSIECVDTLHAIRAQDVGAWTARANRQKGGPPSYDNL